MEIVQMREVEATERPVVKVNRANFHVERAQYKPSRYRDRDDELTIRFDRGAECPMSPEFADFSIWKD